MRCKIRISMIFILSFIEISLAQAQFAVAVGGPDYDYGRSVVQTSDGGFAIAGSAQSFGIGIYNFFLVKLSSVGAVEWSRAVGGPDYLFGDLASSVVQTTDGGFGVTGLTGSYGIGRSDLFLVKLSSVGAVEWSRAVGGPGGDYGVSVVQTTDGGFAVAGCTGSFGGAKDLFLVKFSSAGALEWSRAVGGTGDDYGVSVVQITDGGFAVAGHTYSFGAGDKDLFLVKFSSAGAVEWSKAVGGTGEDWGLSVVQNTDGGYAIAGGTKSFGPGTPDSSNLLLVKFSFAGVLEWSRAVGGTGDDDGVSVVQTTAGGFAIAGCTGSFCPGDKDLFLVKFSSAGAVEWSKAVGGTGDEDGHSVVQTTDGGFAVAGYTGSFGTGDYDLFLVKFDSFGNSCLGEAVFPTVTDVTDSIVVTSVSPSVASPSPSVTVVSPTVTVVSPTVTVICLSLIHI